MRPPPQPKEPPPLELLKNLIHVAPTFASPDGQTFATIPSSDEGFQTFPLRSKAYRDWFHDFAYSKYSLFPTPHVFAAILRHIEARTARDFQCPRRIVPRRIGSRANDLIPQSILLDLANLDGQCVEITPEGWHVTSGYDIIFQTSRHTRRLPPPVPSPDPLADLEILRGLLNLGGRADWLRCLAWLLAAFRPNAYAYPFLILQGPPGSGKSFAACLLRTLVDPCTSPFTPVPHSVRDLHILASYNWVLAFDHVSQLSPLLADALCRVSSGLGIKVREPGEPEHLQQTHRRPVLLTVTSRWTCPGDIASRAFTVNLPPISPDRRRTDEALVSVAEEAFPRILGALCSVLSTAMRRLSEIQLAAAPRHASALAWILAAAPALGCTGEEIWHALAPPPAHPMVEAVQTLLLPSGRWTGTASELLSILETAVSCRTPKGLSQQLRKSELSLADAGIEVTFRRINGGWRRIDLQKQGDPVTHLMATASDASHNSELSLQPAETEELNPS